MFDPMTPTEIVVSEPIQEELNFRRELAQLLNKYSRENASATPDFVLANYLARCLDNWDQTLIDRERYYGRTVKSNTEIESNG